MKYDFRIGDYVKTVDGRVGSIVKLTEITHRHAVDHHMSIEFSNGDSLSGYYNDRGIGYDDFYIYEEFFKRIGKYDFTHATQREKENRIEPLPELGGNYPILEICIMRDKINEIIDYINKSDVSKGE